MFWALMVAPEVGAEHERPRQGCGNGCSGRSTASPAGGRLVPPSLPRGCAGSHGLRLADGAQPGEQFAAGPGDDNPPRPAVRRAPVRRADVQPAPDPDFFGLHCAGHLSYA